jgi:hypothetical protein
MTRQDPENGSAMLVTLIIIAALLAGAVVLVSMQLSSNRSTDLARSSMSSLYCAEAGLHAARAVLKTSLKTERDTAIIQSNSEILAGTTPTESPLFTAGISSHDLDGNGTNDFYAYIRDNDDELAGSGTNNGSADTDSKVWLISVCIKNTETQKTVSELISVTEQAGTMYDWQAGGAMGNNNYNFQNTTY